MFYYYGGMETRLDWHTASTAVGVLSGQVAQLHAQLVATTAQIIADEAWVGDGIRSVEHFLEFRTGLDRGTVRKLTTIAHRVDDLPEAIERLNEGRLTLDQVAILAHRVPATHSADVTAFAESATVTQLRRGLSGWFAEPRKHEPRVKPDTLQLSRLDDQFLLRYATSDLVKAELIEQAIREAKDALFTAGHTEATLADGFVEVAHRSLDAVASDNRRNRYRVLLHLDTDQQTWLHRKGALPGHLADRYTCDATIVPVWETDGRPVAVGRQHRIVPQRIRVLIEDRDKGCRYPGCQATGFLENHHLQHWRDGGVTEPSNLISLCPFHHGELHKGSFTIDGDPQRIAGLVFNNHHGHPLRPANLKAPPPDLPQPAWRGPTGEALQTRWLYFNPNPPTPHAEPAA